MRRRAVANVFQTSIGRNLLTRRCIAMAEGIGNQGLKSPSRVTRVVVLITQRRLNCLQGAAYVRRERPHDDLGGVLPECVRPVEAVCCAVAEALAAARRAVAL